MMFTEVEVAVRRKTLPQTHLFFIRGGCQSLFGEQILPMKRWAVGLILIFFLLGVGTPGESWAAPTGPSIGVQLARETPPGWKSTSTQDLQFLAPPDADRVVAKLGAHGQESLERIRGRLGVDVGPVIKIYVPPTQEAFERLQPGRPPSWADATAYPSQGLIYLRPPRVRGQGDEPLEVVLDHELVHILLGRAFAPQRPPSWLQEGLAQVLAGQYDAAAQRRLAPKIIGARYLSLHDLEDGFPADAHQASAAYATSADFIAWLQMEYGPDVLRRLVAEVRGGYNLQQAVFRITGQPLSRVEKEWRKEHQRGSALWWSAVTSGEAMWAYMGVLALFGVVIARIRIARRTREVMERLRRQESWLSALWPARHPKGMEQEIDAIIRAFEEQNTDEVARPPDSNTDPSVPIEVALTPNSEGDDAPAVDTPDPDRDRT